MDQAQINAIMGALPKGRTLFFYFKDRYALVLLSHFVGAGKPMRVVKQSRFGGLLNKPLLKHPGRSLPGNRLTQDVLESVWNDPDAYRIYRLTLSTWGPEVHWDQGYYQTSRPGKNLVLQLNFSGRHNQPYHRLIRPVDGHPFRVSYHPTSRRELTLAWARLDADLDTGEALVEEVQNDWIRLALWWKYRLKTLSRCSRPMRRRLLTNCLGTPDADAARLFQYVDEVLQPHIEVWDEAMLTATLCFLREDLGIRRIFYHTFDGGNRLKALRYGTPPRSLYTRLPRRFCFRETAGAPSFLMTQRRVRKEVQKGGIRFYLLEL